MYLSCSGTDKLKVCAINMILQSQLINNVAFRYNGTCWIERPDHFVPPLPQKPELGGKASWHEGNREHQLYGRVLSFTVLRALHEALDVWDRQPRHRLTDEMWHMTDYYQNIKTKVRNLDPSIGNCYDIAKKLPTEFCTTTFKVSTSALQKEKPVTIRPKVDRYCFPSPGKDRVHTTSKSCGN